MCAAKKLFLAVHLFILMLLANCTLAQERYGMAISNFGGVSAALFNPAATSNQKAFLDVNLLTLGVSFENNFVFIHRQDYTFGNYLSRDPLLPVTGVRGEGLDYKADQQFIKGFVKTDLIGPSFTISLGEHSFGLFSRAVSVTSAREAPGEIGVLLFEGIDYEPLQNIPLLHEEFAVTSMAWGEVGLNYAYRFSSNQFHYLAAGVNVRRLFGYAGAYLSAYNADYTLLQDTIDIRNINADIGFSLPLDYDNSEFNSAGQLFRGSGTAFDLGISYRRHRSMKLIPHPSRPCAREYQPYLYKIGISLLDIGNIRFNNNAQEHAFENAAAWWPEYDTLEFDGLNSLARHLSEVFYNDPDATLSEVNNMRIGTPAALSLQADVQYYPDWYISGAVILPIKLANYQLERPGQLFVSLRYETDIIEVNVPVSLYDFEKPRIGLYGRYRFLSAGTDKLGGFFGFSDMYGLDFYVALNFRILKGHCIKARRYRDCRHLAF